MTPSKNSAEEVTHRTGKFAAAKEALFSPENPAGFSFGSLRLLAIGIADCAVADAFPFALDAEVAEKLPELRLFKFLLCTVNPYAAKPEGVRGKHHIPHNKAAVIDAVCPVLFGKHDERIAGAP